MVLVLMIWFSGYICSGSLPPWSCPPAARSWSWCPCSAWCCRSRRGTPVETAEDSRHSQPTCPGEHSDSWLSHAGLWNIKTMLLASFCWLFWRSKWISVKPIAHYSEPVSEKSSSFDNEIWYEVMKQVQLNYSSYSGGSLSLTCLVWCECGGVPCCASAHVLWYPQRQHQWGADMSVSWVIRDGFD